MNLDMKPSKATSSIAASALVVSGPGVLTGIFVSGASATPTIKIWDGLTATGTVLLDTFTPTPLQSPYFPPIGFGTGCYITIGGTVNCTLFTTR
jgi:hypothetical protein